MLKLMYVTNIPEVAAIAQDAGVDRIMVDMEYIGKAKRQGQLNTPQNHHTFGDIENIRRILDKTQLVVRCNPIHEGIEDYPDSQEETERIINLGADIIMLPYFKSADEVRKHISYVNGRAKVYLLVETAQAVDNLDEILEIPGIDEIHIGLNDLGICYHKRFLFEVLADGTVDAICSRIRQKGIPYGFGGIGIPGGSMIPAEKLICEHYRLQSTRSILSRAFCNTEKIKDLDVIKNIFETGIRKIRAVELECMTGEIDFVENKSLVQQMVADIVSGIF